MLVLVENGANLLPLRLVGTSETVGESGKNNWWTRCNTRRFKPKLKFIRQDDPSLNISPNENFDVVCHGKIV